jgi:hypothetical protein
LAVGPIWTSIQWVSGAVSQGVKRQGRKTYPSPPCKTGGAIPPLPHTSSLRGASISPKNNFALYIFIVQSWCIVMAYILLVNLYTENNFNVFEICYPVACQTS